MFVKKPLRNRIKNLYIPKKRIKISDILKGLSPILATVMLIALTLAVIGLLGAWFTSLTKEQTRKIGSEAERGINCTIGAGLEIADVICSNVTKELKVAIRNTGQNELYDISTLARINNTLYQNNTGGPNSTNPLYPGQYTILVYGCDSCSSGAKVEWVEVSPFNCPQISDKKNVAVTCG